MKKVFILSSLCLLSFYCYSQKVNVAIIRTRNAAQSEWQILDEYYHQVIREDEYHDADSIIFSLEADKRYFLLISIIDIQKPGVDLYSVRIDNEHILDAGSETEPGDYFYPFFTGTRASQAKIVGGADALISDFPWQIYLTSTDFQCGGSIISAGWVVTAAHCVFNKLGTVYPPSAMTIFAGSTTPSSSGSRYFVSQIIPHPSFNKTTLDYDIALLKVISTISCTNCKPIKLITARNVAEGFTDPGKTAWITGWGLTDPATIVEPTILQKALIPIVSNATASVVWKTIPPTDIMAGYLTGTKDACSGDSGGPLSVFVNGEYKLAGIVSWGSKQCDTYGGYTRESDMESWIRTTTGIYDYTLPVPIGDSVVCPGTGTSSYSEVFVPNALAYEWQLLPAGAGSVSWNQENATVTWNQGFIGTATVRARVKLTDFYSEWGERSVIRALRTKIISQTGDTSICAGVNLSLVMNTEGTIYKYEWYKDGALYKTGLDNFLSWFKAQESVSGNYRAQIYGYCGTVSSDVINVVVYPVTVINRVSPDITSDYGNDITLSVDAGGHNLNYQWIKNDNPVENSNSPDLVMQNVDARNIGLYKVVVKGTCGILTSDSTYVYLKHSAVASAQEVSVWPTVVTDEVNVASGSSGKYDVRIISLSGKVLFSSLNRQYQTSINLNNFPNGLYILNVRGDKINKSFKLVKK